jgi:chromosome segregation ATPase
MYSEQKLIKRKNKNTLQHVARNSMSNHLEERLSQLKSQFSSGQKELEKMQQKQNELQITLLKISGAVQVLEEEITKEKQSGSQ